METVIIIGIIILSPIVTACLFHAMLRISLNAGKGDGSV